MKIDSLLLRAHKKESKPEPEAPAEGGAELNKAESTVVPAPESAAPSTALAVPPMKKMGGLPAGILSSGSQPLPPSGDKTAGVKISEKALATLSNATPVDFKTRLDQLDELMQVEQGITSFNMDAIRGYVKSIMVDLQLQPDLDSCLIDRDIHNILAFIRSVKENAVESRTIVKAKKEAKAAKGGLKGFSLEPIAFDIPKGLEMLGKMKT